MDLNGEYIDQVVEKHGQEKIEEHEELVLDVSFATFLEAYHEFQQFADEFIDDEDIEDFKERMKGKNDGEKEED